MKNDPKTSQATTEAQQADPGPETGEEAAAANAAAAAAAAAEASQEQQKSGEAPATTPSPEEEIQRYRELAMRAQADLDNYRKRMVREKEESIRYANAALLERLLPILDSFELGLQAARQSSEGAAIVQGFAMVEKQLLEFLREHGVEPIDAVGKPFDPNLHDAVSQQHHEEIAEGNVSQQIRKGYKLRDRLLRPSSVIVSKGPARDSASQDSQPS